MSLVDFGCARCNDSGWVCDAHDDVPWLIDGKPHCGAQGAPCPDCNHSTDRQDLPDTSRHLRGAGGGEHLRLG